MKKRHSLYLRPMLLFALTVGVSAQAQREEKAESVRTGVISGRVVNQNGEGLENAKVSIAVRNGYSPAETVSTDREGRFQLTDLEPALYAVSASVPTYTEPFHQPSYYRIGDTVTVTLVKGGVITGTVTSAAGEPLVRTRVTAVRIMDLDGNKYAIDQVERATDDRGVYRLYGLPPGRYLVATKGGPVNFDGTSNENGMTIYAPSSMRDNASEITLRSGEERNGVDIRYRTESGHTVSGTVDGPKSPDESYSGARVNFTQLSHGARFRVGSAQVQSNRAFALSDVADGEYELNAFSTLGPNEFAIAEPRRITVRGADVTGLQLITKPLGSIGGHVVLENSNAPECKGKRKPLLTETLVLLKDNSKEPARDVLRGIWHSQEMAPDKSWDVLFGNLGAGQYRFDIQFSAKYWYFKTPAQPTNMVKPLPANPRVDGTQDWISLKQGQRLNGLTLTLSEGAASLQGRIKPAEGNIITSQIYMHLVPSEKENAEDALRYFASPVNADGTFTLGNLPPGKYWSLARVVEGDGARWVSKLRLPDQSQTRSKVRAEAEAAKVEIELKPCQNVTDYQLSLKS